MFSGETTTDWASKVFQFILLLFFYTKVTDFLHVCAILCSFKNVSRVFSTLVRAFTSYQTKLTQQLGYCSECFFFPQNETLPSQTMAAQRVDVTDSHCIFKLASDSNGCEIFIRPHNSLCGAREFGVFFFATNEKPSHIKKRFWNWRLHKRVSV